MKNEAKDYVWIARWGYHLGSFEYYIKDQQDKAAAEDAPLNAIYERDGVWHVVNDVQNLHRVSHEMSNGPLPDGMMVCHKRSCKACTRDRMRRRYNAARSQSAYLGGTDGR